MFFRLHTDRTRSPLVLDGLFSGPRRSACWIIGGGPSLNEAPLEEIARGPVPTFGVNLAGSGRLRPDFWTSYDPSARFHRSVYLDAGVLKFLHARRGMDLVPETTFKVCECPGAVFFETDAERDFRDCLAGAQDAALGGRRDSKADRLVDWADSFLQAIALAVRLGFRELICLGCEMHIAPSEELARLARTRGVDPEPHESLRDFVRRCEEAGLSREQLERTAHPRPYHFDETKTLDAAMTTDDHYFRVTQALRLCRRPLAEAGVELRSATPDSRLNDHFEFRTAGEHLADLRRRFGDPTSERTAGRYALDGPRLDRSVGPMRDVLPYRRPKSRKEEQPQEHGPEDAFINEVA